MAKKDYSLDEEDLNFDDFGFDEFDDDGEDPSANPRKPTSKIRSKLEESAEAKYRDSKFRRELLKASLPSDYSSVLEDYDAVSKEVGEVWREQQKQWEKHRSGVKRAIRPYSDVISKLGFKKLEAWANEEDRVSSGTPSDDEIDELKVQSIMADVFGDMQEEQTKHLTQLETARQEREDERYAEDVAEREVTAKRSIESNNYLANINKGITTLTDYTNKIDFHYKKRSLELQARLLITQQRALTTLSSFKDSTIKELQDIHKNTALPDYLKINTDEMITKAFKEKFAENFTTPWTGVGSRLSKNVFNKVKGKLNDWWEDIGMAISGANDANEGFADGMGGGDGTAWGGLKDLGMGFFTDALVNKPANFLQSKVAPKVRDYLSKHHKINVYGSNLKSMGSNFAAKFNEALKSGETGNKLLDTLINVFDLQGAAIGEKNTLWDTKDLDLEKAVYMDNRFKLSVTDVIPGWLKKIYGQVFGLNNQGKEAPDISWDFKSEGFVRTEDQDRETLEGLVNKESIAKQKLAIERWIDSVSGGMALSNKSRKFLHGWVKKKLRGSDALDPMALLSDTLDAPRDVKSELEKVIIARYQLTDKQVDLAKGGSLWELGKLISEGNTHANNLLHQSANAAMDARTHVRSAETDALAKLASTPEGRRALIRSGRAYNDGSGQFVYNYKVDDELQDQFEYVRERERRVGGKTVKDRVGTYVGRRAQFEDGRHYLSDDGRADILDREGYDDFDVLLKKDAKFGFGAEYLGYSDEKKLERAILKSLSTLPDPTMHPGYGRDFFFTRDGKLITRANKAFVMLRRKEAPELASKYSYASGGRIPSFASGGNNKLMAGVTKGQPGDEKLVKTHGGEFVVNHDAAKFNVKLLGAINKYGAPLINSDGSINSVYHKVFGFDKAKDFTKQAGKDFAVGAQNIKNEQAEIAIKHIISQMNPKYLEHYDKVVAELTDKKVTPEKRLAKGLQHWTKYQKEVVKHEGIKAYGKGAARKGLAYLGNKFDQWIDTDGTGTNVQIKNQVVNGVSSVASNVGNVVKNKLDRQKELARSALLNRDLTLEQVQKQLEADETGSNKRYTKVHDIYIEGQKSPILRRLAWVDPGYFDKQTDKRLKTPDQITGTVIDSRGNTVVTTEQLLYDQFYTVDNGKVTPFKFLGMQEGNRRFDTIDQKLDMIRDSKRYKEIMERYKGYSDTAKKYLKDEAIDVYVRDDLTTPKLRAADFKAGNYIDKNTGNVLWTHHDITGAVVNKENQEILSEEQVADGLFNVKGEHIKINKLKRIRNTIFKRGNELYNRYAAKHVNKYKDVALNAMSGMGEAKVGLNFDKNPIDVYVKGEKNPRITFAMFKSGKMMDVKSGKPILSHSGIQGPVISAADSTGNQLITEDDIKTGLVDAMGEELYLPKMQTSLKRFTNYLKEAVLPKSKFGAIRNFINLSPEKRMEKMNELIDKYGVAFDVYVKGEPLTPKLTKAGFEGSKYISQKTGLAIKLPDFIDGPVLDLEGNVILTAEEIEKGLLTIDGKKVKIGVDLKNGGLFNNVAGAASIFSRISGKRNMLLRGMGLGDKVPEPVEEKTERNVLYTIKFKNKKGMPLSPEAARLNNRMFTQADVKGGMLVRIEYAEGKSTSEIVDDVHDIDASTWLKSAMSDKVTDGVNFGAVLTMGGYVIDDEGKLIKIAPHNAKKKAKPAKLDVAGANPLKGMFGSTFDKLLDKFGIKNRLGSWQQQREDKAKEKAEGKDKGEDKKEKKDSWIGKLIKKLTLPLSVMFGSIASGVGALKASLLGGLAWLGQAFVTKSALGGLGSFLTSRGLGRAVAVGALTYGGIKTYNYLNGEDSGVSSYGAADQNAQYANLDTTSKVLNMGDPNAPQSTSGKGFLETVASNPELASALAMGAMMIPGAAKGIGRGALAVGKKAWKWGGAGLGWGAKKLGRAAGGTARVAGRVGAKVVPKSLKVGGSILKNSWRLSGGMGGMALRAAIFAGPLIVPGLIAAGIGTALYFGGKAIMKGLENKKNPWNRFRMAQYGFTHHDKELKEKIGKIETYATALISINGDGQPVVKVDDKAMTEILKVCGLRDQEGNVVPGKEKQLESFAIWFKQRFLRVYASYLRCLKKMRGKAEMIDLLSLNRKEQLKLLEDTHFKSLTMSPYVVTNSPFEDPAETTMDATDVDVIYRQIKNQIETSKDIRDGEVKDYSADKNADGLENKIAKPLPKNASHEDKLKHEMDKQLDQTAANKTHTDAKTMVDKANEAVKYQADAANILTKTHNAQIRSATDQATKESESLFSKAMTSLQDKFTNFLSASRTAASKIFSGTAGGFVDGVGDAAGVVTGGLGNSLFSGGQAVLDKLRGSNKDAEKNLVQLAMKSGVTDPKEITMLLAQASHESGGFKHSRELGNDAYFAKYNNRKDLGNGPNDGARYKGRGWIQLTGRANYAAFSKWAGIDAVSNPEMVEKEPYASLATIWYWTQSSNMKRFGRKAAINGDITGATKAVNGGTNGLKDRQERFAKYSSLIGNDAGAYLAKLGGSTPADGGSTPKSTPGAKPPAFMMTGGTTTAGQSPAAKAGGGMVGGAMANLDARFGNKVSASAATTPQQSNSVNIAGSADWNFDKVADTVVRNRKEKSKGKCAEHVRMGLVAGDLKGKIKNMFGGRLGHAYEYLTNLPKLGFNAVFRGTSLKGFTPMKGDVAVFDRKTYGQDKPNEGGWVYGHVCVWTGSNWVSDFIQASVYPHSRYSAKGLPFTVFRANGIASKSMTALPIGDENVGTPTSTANQTQSQASQSTSTSQAAPAVQKVSATVNNLNNGGVTTAAPVSAPQPASPMEQLGNGGDVINLLGKQLNVQEQILSVLKDIAKVGTAKLEQNSRPGVTTPNLTAIRNEKSQFEGVKNPVSVLKPV